jgi:hypothetical protein
MAVLTRFTSTSPTPADINQVQASPDVWSQTAQANLQGQKMVGDALDQSLGQIGQILERDQKTEDKLYLAQAKADMQVQLNNQFKTMQATAKSGGNFGVDSLKSFDTMARNYIDNAPSAATKEALVRDIVGLRTTTYKQASGYQDKLNYQADLVSFNQTANGLQTLAVQDPSDGTINTIKGQINNLSQAMLDKGYDQLHVNSLKENTLNTLDKQVAMGLSKNNPAAAMSALDSGAYSKFGAAFENTIRTRVDSQFKAQISDLNKQGDDITSRIINDQAMPTDFSSTIARAATLANHDPAVAVRFNDIQRLQQFSSTMRAQPLAAQRDELINLASAAQEDPSITPKLRMDMERVLKANITAMNEDPLGYTAKHNLADLPPLPKDASTPQGQAAIQARRLAAATARTVTGLTDVVPMTRAELDENANKLQQLAPIEQLSYMKALSQFGQDLAPAIAKRIAGKGEEDPLAIALMRFNDDAVTSAAILKGSALMRKGGLATASKPEERKSAASDIQLMFPEDPELQIQVIKAADAYRAGTGASVINTDHVDKVVGAIPAGSFFGGYKTIAPKAGMGRGDFNTLVSSVTLQDMIQFGNGEPSYSPGSVFNPGDDPLDNYELKPVNLYSGEYYVTRNGKALKTSDGFVYKMNLRKFADR